MGLAVSTGKDNDELVDNLAASDSLKTTGIEKVMRLVDRGRFIPEAERENAYKDSAWKSNTADWEPGALHISAPCIYASVLENLDLAEGISFLNVGSGTGYLSSMAGFILGENGISHGVELYPKVVQYANERIAEMQRSAEVSAFGWCAPKFFVGNAFLMESNMRYDRIYCGALVPESRRAFFCSFLKVGGVLIMPYGHALQRICRKTESEFWIRDISAVTFSHLVPINPDNPLTNQPAQLPLNSPPLLSSICRDSIRQRIRQRVAQTHGVEMRVATCKCSQMGNSRTRTDEEEQEQHHANDQQQSEEDHQDQQGEEGEDEGEVVGAVRVRASSDPGGYGAETGGNNGQNRRPPTDRQQNSRLRMRQWLRQQNRRIRPVIMFEGTVRRHGPAGGGNDNENAEELNRNINRFHPMRHLFDLVARERLIRHHAARARQAAGLDFDREQNRQAEEGGEAQPPVLIRIRGTIQRRAQPAADEQMMHQREQQEEGELTANSDAQFGFRFISENRFDDDEDGIPLRNLFEEDDDERDEEDEAGRRDVAGRDGRVDEEGETGEEENAEETINNLMENGDGNENMEEEEDGGKEAEEDGNEIGNCAKSIDKMEVEEKAEAGGDGEFISLGEGEKEEQQLKGALAMLTPNAEGEEEGEGGDGEAQSSAEEEHLPVKKIAADEKKQSAEGEATIPTMVANNNSFQSSAGKRQRPHTAQSLEGSPQARKIQRTFSHGKHQHDNVSKEEKSLSPSSSSKHDNLMEFTSDDDNNKKSAAADCSQEDGSIADPADPHHNKSSQDTSATDRSFLSSTSATVSTQTRGTTNTTNNESDVSASSTMEICSGCGGYRSSMSMLPLDGSTSSAARGDGTGEGEGGETEKDEGNSPSISAERQAESLRDFHNEFERLVDSLPLNPLMRRFLKFDI